MVEPKDIETELKAKREQVLSFIGKSEDASKSIRAYEHLLAIELKLEALSIHTEDDT